MEYLGHIATGMRVSTAPTKVKAIKEWPLPQSVKKIRESLGLTGYYRKFVKGCECLSNPLTELPKKDTFRWSDEARDASKNSR